MKEKATNAIQNSSTETAEPTSAPPQRPQPKELTDCLNQHEQESAYSQFAIYGRSIRQIARQSGASEKYLERFLFQRVAEDAVQRERRRARLAKENEVASAFPFKQKTN